MIELQIKDLVVNVDYIIDRRRLGWSIIFKKPNIVVFKTNQIMTIDEIALELSKHYRFLKRRMTVVPKEFSNSIHLFGNEYELIKVESDAKRLVLMGDKAYLYTDSDNYEYNKIIVDRFYEENLREFVDNHIDQAKRDLKIDFPITIDYKHVKTYYGECMPKRRKIIFQQSLAKYNEYYILSVIYHELAHFYYQNHQEGFYKLLESVFPGYKKVQSNLRKTKYNDIY